MVLKSTQQEQNQGVANHLHGIQLLLQALDACWDLPGLPYTTKHQCLLDALKAAFADAARICALQGEATA